MGLSGGTTLRSHWLPRSNCTLRGSRTNVPVCVGLQALFVLGEKDYALDWHVQKTYHIRGWLRFRDDILFVAGGNLETRKAFLDGF